MSGSSDTAAGSVEVFHLGLIEEIGFREILFRLTANKPFAEVVPLFALDSLSGGYVALVAVVFCAATKPARNVTASGS